jgi:hypothetical protein
MNNVEQLIAKLIDEKKITGEEAIILIRACDQSPPNSNLRIDDFRPKVGPLYPHDKILYHKDNQNSILNDTYTLSCTADLPIDRSTKCNNG